MNEQCQLTQPSTLTLDTEDIINIIDSAIVWVYNSNHSSCSALRQACFKSLEEYPVMLISLTHHYLDVSYRAHSKGKRHFEGFSDISAEDWGTLSKEDIINIRVTKLIYYKFHVKLNNFTFMVSI